MLSQTSLKSYILHSSQNHILQRIKSSKFDGASQEPRQLKIIIIIIIIISLCIKRQSTGQQPHQPNARREARPEIEFLCKTSSEFLRSCNVGPRTASNEPCWRRNGPVQFYDGLAAPIPSAAARVRIALDKATL